MAVSFFPTDQISVHVDDPGYGYLVVCFDRQNRQATLRGRDMWRALESLTELACSVQVAGDVDELWSMSIGEAHKLLPAFQCAVLYAAAGSNRAERLTDVDEIHDPLCVRCDEGSNYSPEVSCDEYGHQPFGYAGRWEHAQVAVKSERNWAEIHNRITTKNEADA